jgi:hypothetical protein
LQKKGGRTFFDYSTNNLINAVDTIIVDVAATTEIRRAKVLATKPWSSRKLSRALVRIILANWNCN